MKNKMCVNELQECNRCKLKGFFCYTPFGADFETCPCCGKNDFLNKSVNYKKLPTKYDFLYEYENDMRYSYKYCNFCKIIFEVGCMHCVVGCTDNVYNCHFIKKWKDKITNVEYYGMPCFDDENDWFDNVNNVDVLEMYCPHNGYTCNMSYTTETCKLKK